MSGATGHSTADRTAARISVDDRRLLGARITNLTGWWESLCVVRPYGAPLHTSRPLANCRDNATAMLCVSFLPQRLPRS
jgi:hypothetical protein